MKQIILHGLVLAISSLLFMDVAAQDLKRFRFFSDHTSFPDTARKNGYLYDTVLYDAATHYSDNAVLLIVPPQFSAKEKIDLVFWFHGWLNNIDSAENYFELGKQFIASKRNAVLVLAETAKNAPDSYGGKLERPGMFSLLVEDILRELKKQKIIAPQVVPGKITLSGHSGAYLVISRILQNGDLPVHEVLLFDALYGQQFKFMNWIKENPQNRFIDIFTDHGGTAGNSYEFMEQLPKEDISFIKREEAALSADDLKSNRIIFVHSLHKHNDIIKKPDNFQLFLTLKPD